MGRARAAMDWVPLTPLGLILGLSSVYAWWSLGLGREDLVVRMLASVTAILLGLSALTTVVAALQLRARLSARQRNPEPLVLEVGHAGPTGFTARVAFPLPLVDAHVRWIEPAVEHRLVWVRGALEERVVPLRRGEFDTIERVVTVEDHLGLCRVRFRSIERREVHFLPSVGSLKNIEAVQGMTGGDGLAHPDGPPSGDPMDIRHYGEGDPIRYVLWKVFARSRTLVVRTPERAISPEERTVAYLVTSPHDQAAAGAARVAVETRALGGRWKMAADGSEEVATDKAHAMRLILRSAACDSPHGGHGLGRFLATLDGPTRRAVVFVPPVPGPWIEQVVACQRALGAGALDLVVCVDGIGKPDSVQRWWTRRSPPREGACPEALAEVLRRLSGAGRLAVLDRATGRFHPESHLTALTRRAG
jgi:uncharacterized protein (DUF58 family)